MKILSGAVLKNSKAMNKLDTLKNTLYSYKVNFDEGSEVEVRQKALMAAKPTSITVDEIGKPVSVRAKLEVGGRLVQCDYRIEKGQLYTKTAYVKK